MRKNIADVILSVKKRFFKVFNFELSRYQKLLIQWIELENRVKSFLKKYKKYDNCNSSEISKDLNNEKRLKICFLFLI